MTDSATATETVSDVPGMRRRHSVAGQFMRAVFANRGAAIGFVLVVFVILAALLASWVAPYSPNQMGAGPRLAAPSADYWFGTDEFGRDMLSRVIFGSRYTLQIGLVAVGISLTVGMTIGLLGGYARGWIERILMRSMDVLFSFTETLIALAAVAILGPSLTNAVIAVGIATIPIYARVAYSVTLAERNRPYFSAAIAAGAGNFRLVFVHLLPNVIPPMIVVATLGVSTAVLAASGLSFLGLGAQPPVPEWGALLSTGREYLTQAPWLMIYPGLALMTTVLAFNLLGDGIREALDPRQRRH